MDYDRGFQKDGIEGASLGGAGVQKTQVETNKPANFKGVSRTWLVVAIVAMVLVVILGVLLVLVCVGVVGLSEDCDGISVEEEVVTEVTSDERLKGFDFQISELLSNSEDVSIRDYTTIYDMFITETGRYIVAEVSRSRYLSKDGLTFEWVPSDMALAYYRSIENGSNWKLIGDRQALLGCLEFDDMVSDDSGYLEVARAVDLNVCYDEETGQEIKK